MNRKMKGRENVYDVNDENDRFRNCKLSWNYRESKGRRTLGNYLDDYILSCWTYLLVSGESEKYRGKRKIALDHHRWVRTAGKTLNKKKLKFAKHRRQRNPDAPYKAVRMLNAAHGLTKQGVTLCLTNDPTTLNCNLFRTCWLAYVGIETMRLMDNTY